MLVPVPDGPPAATSNPLSLLWHDMRADRAAKVPFPPGEMSFSLARTTRFDRDPLGMLLEGYERYGPVFTIKVFHHNAVFMLGAEANHYMLVSNAKNFLWRSGHFRDLIPLMGDGLLTIDGAFHRTHRRLMLPAFHRERIEAATTVMQEEVDLALEQFRPGEVVDLYHWTRGVALRVALRRCSDRSRHRARRRRERSRGVRVGAVVLRARLSASDPARSVHALRADEASPAAAGRADLRRDRAPALERRAWSGHPLDAARRQRRGRPGAGPQHIRDEVMTLLFAGHDTTTSTVTFLFYELARNPHVLDEPDVSVEMIVDETLRKYPPAYIGPRRSVEAFEFNGFTVPARAHVHYCSWASHHLPDVFPEPERFLPQRFSEENRAKLPPGAYVPFGGGSRTCIGMRFGQAEIAVIARSILERYRLQIEPGYELEIRHAPTISPRQGLPMRVLPGTGGPERPRRGAAGRSRGASSLP